MKTVKAVAYTILFWFGGFLSVFLCITVLNAVVTGMVGISHIEAMASAYKGYAGISGILASVLALVYMRDTGLLENMYQEQPITEKQEHHDKIKWFEE